jgi:hypothetical protein
LVVHSLVVALLVIMGHELSNRGTQHVLTEKDHPIQTVFFDGSYKSFGVGVVGEIPERPEFLRFFSLIRS